MLDKVKFQSNHYANHAKFWEDQLAHHNTDFSFRQAGLPAGNKTKEELIFVIEGPLKDQLNKITKANITALFSLTTSSLCLLLKRYSLQDTIILDMPCLNDGTPLLDNSVPLVLQIDETLTLKGFLNKTNTLIRDSYRYQEYLPMLSDNGFHTNILCCAPALHERMPATDTYGLIISVEQGSADITLRIQFDTACFKKAYLTQFYQHLKALLENTAKLDTHLTEITLLSAGEEALIFSFSEGEKVTGWSNRSIPALLKEKARAVPWATAVIYKDTPLTYEELDRKSDIVAGLLRQSFGVQAGDNIGIYIDRSELMIIAIVAALKAGAAYVPVDPAIPEQRTAFILEDAQVSVLLTVSDYMFNLAYFSGQLFVMDIQADEVFDTEMPVILPDNPAYIIYTSGSTGQPKGVLIKHKNILNTIYWRNTSYGFQPGHNILQIPSVAFDSSVEDIFCTLLAGATLIIPEEQRRKEVFYLRQLIQKYAVTHFLITPSFYDVLLDELDGQQHQLQAVTVAGEATTAHLISKHARVLQNVRMVNEYGPTENAVCSTVYTCQPDAPVSIGKPVFNVNLYILDERRRLLPLETTGEIYLAGDGLCEGYIHNEQLNSERFVNIELNGQLQRLYRTGDLGSWTADGNILFTGRKDDQVKLNGYRIELGEIESVIRKQSGVADCKVLVSGEQPKQLFAVLKPDLHKEYTLSKLAGHLYRQPDFTKHCTLLPNGMLLRYMNKAETALIYQEIFEDQLYFRHNITLEDGAVVFDVGANVGVFSLFTGLHCRNALIYAFEPLRPVFEALSINTGLYDIQITPYNIGLSDAEGTAEFIYYPGNTASSGRYGNVAQEREMGRTVLRNIEKYDTLDNTQIEQLIDEGIKYEKHVCKLDTLSNVIRRENITVIDLLKIDVEKSELDVLAGIAAEDWQKIRQIVAEVHDIDDHLARIEQLLTENGFEFIKDQPPFLQHTGIYYLYARQKGLVTTVSAARFKPLQFNKEGNITDVAYYLEQVKHACQHILPQYMVPAHFALIPELPLTNNGKIDYKTLHAWVEKTLQKDKDYSPPRNPLEVLLCNVWAKAIGRESVGINDNFFEIGGDSIKAIQIAGRMHKEGYKVEVKDIFEQLTIGNLSETITTANAAVDQSPVSGEVPFTPVQYEMFPVHMPDPHHFNQSIMFYSAEKLELDAIQVVFAKLQEHHDALRMTCTMENGEWKQVNQPLGMPISITEYSLTSTDVIDELANEVQQSISLETGPLMKLALFRLADGDRLLITIHHMVVDGISWRILLEDIGSLFDQHRKGRELTLPLKTTSFKAWSEGLRTYVSSDAFQQEKEYWQQYGCDEGSIIPPDIEGALPGQARWEQFETCTFELSEKETALLTGKAHRPFNTGINELLLTALGIAVRDVFHISTVPVMLEGHGREPILPDHDISRTVGWFTCTYPVHLVIEDQDMAAQIINIKEYLRNIPNKGIGYGLLKYLFEGRRAAVVPSNLIFNYLGQFDEDVKGSTFEIAKESTGQHTSPLQTSTQDLSILCAITEKRFSVTIAYNTHYFREATIRKLTETYERQLQTLISFCCNYEQREISPSDLSVRGISTENIDKIKALFQ